MGKHWKQCQTLFFWAPKITADGDFSHEIRRRLLLGRKVMTNLDSISLPKGTSTLLVELVALTRALELSKGQWIGLIIYVSLLLLTPNILSLPLDPQDNAFLSWAHSYAAFHNPSNCWVCGALPSSSVEGFPWWTSPLQGKGFLQV